MSNEHKFDAFEAILKSTFKTDYSKRKRVYHNDQVKVEKIFWSTVIGLYHQYGKIDVDTVFRALVAILYDRPSLERDLFSSFEGRLSSEFIFEKSQLKIAKQKVEQGKKIKQNLITALEQIVQESVISEPPQKIDLQLSKNHQPRLPSISMVVNELRTMAHGGIVDGPLYYPFKNKLSTPQRNSLRKVSESYLPHFLVEVLSQRIDSWHNSSEDIFYYRKRVKNVRDAVKDDIVTYPWELGYSDVQLAHRIFHYYCDLAENDFKFDSILSAIERYYRNK